MLLKKIGKTYEFFWQSWIMIFVKKLIKEWDPKIAAEVLTNTNPDYYDSICWLLGGNIYKHSQDWCQSVGRNIDWELMSQNLSKVRKGEVETIENCISILTRLKVPIMRSMVSQFADVIQTTLLNVAFSDIRFGDGIKVLFEVFPKEVKQNYFFFGC